MRKETLDAPSNIVGLTRTASPTNSVTLFTALNMIRNGAQKQPVKCGVVGIG